MMNGDMSGWYSGMSSGHWIFGVLIGVAVIAVIAAAIKYLANSK